ncbi:MAG TPA: GNAT family N-acetyltransferase [Kofleriaceae bacterium]
MRIVELDASDALLERFYRDVYLPEFSSQREPLDAWQSALRGEQPYRMFVRLAVDGDAILGGVTYELYPRSGCGFITYVVVAPSARRAGLGKQLVLDPAYALSALGARYVFGEMRDPRRGGSWDRLERFQRWGCRVVDVRYVQPVLGPGLERDRGLVLIAHPPYLEPDVDGAALRAFIAELHEVTERREPDAELREILDAIGERVPLVELAR